MKQLSIIIVSYENKAVLFDCLDSIRTYNDIGESLEIIVVEQSRSEEIFHEIESSYPEIIAIRNKNEGFGSGNNAGANKASGELLLFLNPDTILVEPVLKRALEIFHANKNLGMFGFRLLDKDGDYNKSFHFRKPYGIMRAIAWRVCNRLDIYMPKSMYIAGADMFVPKTVFCQIGGFDKEMFMYFEETYLCNRLNELGYETAFFPDRQIIHLEGQSSASINTFKKQLDSLRRLCSLNNLSYQRCLQKMRRDRRLKSLIPGKKETVLAEIELIDEAINHASA